MNEVEMSNDYQFHSQKALESAIFFLQSLGGGSTITKLLLLINLADEIAVWKLGNPITYGSPPVDQHDATSGNAKWENHITLKGDNDLILTKAPGTFSNLSTAEAKILAEIVRKYREFDVDDTRRMWSIYHFDEGEVHDEIDVNFENHLFPRSGTDILIKLGVNRSEIDDIFGKFEFMHVMMETLLRT